MAPTAATLVRRLVLDALLALKADKASPTFTGKVTTPQLQITSGLYNGATLASDGAGNVIAISRNQGGVWNMETVLNSGTLFAGYNDLLGGVQVNNPYNTAGILLDSLSVRLADPAATVGAGDLTIQIYLGTPTAAETTLIATSVIPANGHDIITVLATAVQCAHNSVLRAKVVAGTASVAGPVHVQYRGRYV